MNLVFSTEERIEKILYLRVVKTAPQAQTLIPNEEGHSTHIYMNPLGTCFFDLMSLNFEEILNWARSNLGSITSAEDFHVVKKDLQKYVELVNALYCKNAFFTRMYNEIFQLLVQGNYEPFASCIKTLSRYKAYLDRSITDESFLSSLCFILACNMGIFDKLPECIISYGVFEVKPLKDTDYTDESLMFEMLKREYERELKIENGENPIVLMSYEPKSIAMACSASLFEILKCKCQIKKCANCGKYFIPFNRSDSIYCDRQSPQDKLKNCKEYGAQRTYLENLKNNEAAHLYRNIYMSKQMLVKRNPDISEYKLDFENYKVRATQFKSDVKTGIKTEAEYIEWLKGIKEKKA